MKTYIPFLLLLSSFSAFSENSTYQSDAGIAFINSETEASGSLVGTATASGYLLNANVNLNPIDFSKGPLALARFLNPATGIQFSASKVDIDIRGYSGSTSTSYFIAPRVALGDNVIIGAGYGLSKIDRDSGTQQPDSENYSFEAVYYFDDVTAINTIINEEDGDYIYRVSAANLITLSGNDKIFLTGGFEYLDDSGVDAEKEKTINIDATYYPNNKLSFGVDYYNYSTETEDGDGNQLNIEAKYFLNPKAAVSSIVGRSIIDTGFDGDLKSDIVALAAEFRF